MGIDVLETLLVPDRHPRNDVEAILQAQRGWSLRQPKHDIGDKLYRLSLDTTIKQCGQCGHVTERVDRFIVERFTVGQITIRPEYVQYSTGNCLFTGNISEEKVWTVRKDAVNACKTLNSSEKRSR